MKVHGKREGLSDIGQTGMIINLQRVAMYIKQAYALAAKAKAYARRN